MSFQKSSIARIILLSLLTFVFVAFASAQNARPPVQVPPKHPYALAGATNLYCAGYIQSNAISTANKIIGGQNEADHFLYSQNDFLYINLGHDKGVNVGDIFTVVRPRGEVNSKWSHKNDLGFYVQEVGALEVVKVKANVSAVRVKTSCDNLLLGDLVQLVDGRVSPMYEQRPPMDVFGDASGKAVGRILMARDGAEAIATDFIVYVDLGADDHVQVGDRLTVFRPLEGGNLFHHPDRESVSSRDYGFESEDYKGGKFSNQSTRKSGERADGQEVRTLQVRNQRPFDMRKVVGEAVVLNVKERTATVVITRNAQEIHTGDWVEIQ